MLDTATRLRGAEPSRCVRCCLDYVWDCVDDMQHAICGVTGLASVLALILGPPGSTEDSMGTPKVLVGTKLIRNRPLKVINRDLLRGPKANGHFVTSTCASPLMELEAERCRHKLASSHARPAPLPRMGRGPAVRVTAAMNPREPMVSSPKA